MFNKYLDNQVPFRLNYGRTMPNTIDLRSGCTNSDRLLANRQSVAVGHQEAASTLDDVLFIWSTLSLESTILGSITIILVEHVATLTLACWIQRSIVLNLRSIKKG